MNVLKEIKMKFVLNILAWIGTVAWVLLYFTRPVWVAIYGADVFFQFLRMLYYWNTPGVHAGWTLVGHYLSGVILLLLTLGYFPKRLDFGAKTKTK